MSDPYARIQVTPMKGYTMTYTVPTAAEMVWRICGSCKEPHLSDTTAVVFDVVCPECGIDLGTVPTICEMYNSSLLTWRLG